VNNEIHDLVSYQWEIRAVNEEAAIEEAVIEQIDCVGDQFWLGHFDFLEGDLVLLVYELVLGFLVLYLDVLLGYLELHLNWCVEIDLLDSGEDLVHPLSHLLFRFLFHPLLRHYSQHHCFHFSVRRFVCRKPRRANRSSAEHSQPEQDLQQEQQTQEEQMPSFVAFEEIVPSFATFVAFVASLPWDPSSQVQVQVREQTHELDFPSSFFQLANCGVYVGKLAEKKISNGGDGAVRFVLMRYESTFNVDSSGCAMEEWQPPRRPLLWGGNSEDTNGIVSIHTNHPIKEAPWTEFTQSPCLGYSQTKASPSSLHTVPGAHARTIHTPLLQTAQ
jgi:hypothetical protein